ncbi:MAG: hypothetical protein HGA37_01310 [Lentimicrobium sp.]|nr:hypothetical protein [Lentimicrobium sp.]
MKVLSSILHLKPDFRVSLILAFWLIHLTTFSQQPANKRYAFEAKGQSLSVVLDRLSELAPVNFTYNSADPSFSKKITYRASNKTFEQILSDILKISGHNSRQIGNQLVVYRIDAPPSEAVVQESETSGLPPAPRIDTVLSIVEKPVILNDTLVLTDTIVKTDTLLVRDTVYLEKEVIRYRRPGLKIFSKDFFKSEPNRNDGLSLAFSYGQYYGGSSCTAGPEYSELLALTKETESMSFRNFSLGSDLNYTMSKWTFSAGLQLTGFSNRFQYNYIQSTGGYYQTDTISWYYNIIEEDTTWIAVTDSSYLPLDKEEVSYNQLNRLGFLDLQAGVTYSYFSNESFRLYLKAAFSYSFLIYSDGILLQDKPGFPGIDYSEVDFARGLFSYQFGTGISYMAGNSFDVFAEAAYKSYSSKLINDYPIDKRYFGVGLKLGLIYYF